MRITGFIVGLVTIALGIYLLVSIGSNLNPRNTINAVFQVIFGLLICIAEMRIVRLLRYFYFLQHFLGLGMYYIFLGGLALGGAWYQIAVAAVCLGIGLIYFVLGLGCRRMGRENFKKDGVQLPPVLTGVETPEGTPSAAAAAKAASAAYGAAYGSNGGPPAYEEPAAIKAARSNAGAYSNNAYEPDEPAAYGSEPAYAQESPSGASAYANSAPSAYSNDAEIV